MGLKAVVAVLLMVAGAANAAEIDLSKGRLFQSGSDYSIQTVGAVNNSGMTINYLEVECGFFHKGKLIRSGEGAAQNIGPGQKAYFDVRSSDTPDADSTECRVSGVTPQETGKVPQTSLPPTWDQIIAMRAAMVALITITAIDLSKTTGKPPQALLDVMEKASAEAIKTAGIGGADDPEAIRSAAQDRLKEMFAGIHF